MLFLTLKPQENLKTLQTTKSIMPHSKAKDKKNKSLKHVSSSKKLPKSKTNKSLIKVANTIKADSEINRGRRVLHTKTGDIVVRPTIKFKKMKHKSKINHIPSVPRAIDHKKIDASGSGKGSLAKVNSHSLDELYSKTIEKQDSTYYGSASSSTEESTPMIIRGSDIGARDDDDDDSLHKSNKK